MLNAIVSSEYIRFKQTSETVCSDGWVPDEIRERVPADWEELCMLLNGLLVLFYSVVQLNSSYTENDHWRARGNQEKHAIWDHTVLRATQQQ